MNRDRYERLKAVFHGAVEAAPEMRSKYISAQCAGDDELETEVLLLLGQLADASEFLESSPSTPAPGAPAGPPGGSIAASDALRFASYTVLRTLGRGGMGVVYLAQQDGTKRTVALKVIRAGLATPGTLKRFAFEAQVLGRLNHPGIAQVYEAGTGDSGHGLQPYFAMELVDGVPITQHVQEKSLSVRDRLALLAQVCDAVEYAHVKGVIHRDLKPGNVLVDRVGRVKVLDFGVARATTPFPDSSLIGLPSLHTEHGQMVGTLPYMSPEQIAGDPDDLDTRSDVHALGAIGYELLAGKPAFSVDRLAPLEAARIVQQNDPAPLSSLRADCRGDIETVIAKAMEKDRERRYQSAAAFAGDIRRFLNDEPIEARPASAWYQARRFARRNRLAVTTTAILTGGLVLTTVGATAVALRESALATEIAGARARELDLRREAQRERQEALRQAEVARSVSAFVRGMLGAVNPLEQGRNVRVIDILETAEGAVDEELSSKPAVAGSVRLTIGRSYLSLGRFGEARANLETALRLLDDNAGPDDPESLEARSQLGTLEWRVRELAAAERLFRATIDGRSRTFGPLHQCTLTSQNDLALVLLDQGKVREAEELLARTVSSQRTILGTEHPETLTTGHNLGLVYLNQGRAHDAAQLFSEILDARERVLRPDHPDTLATIHNLAAACADTGRLDDALTLMERVCAAKERVLGPDHADTIRSVGGRAVILLRMKRPDAAEPLLREVEAARARTLGTSHVLTRGSARMAAIAVHEQGRLDEASEMLARALRTALECASCDDRETMDLRRAYSACLADLGRFAEADEQLVAALEFARRTDGPDGPITSAMTRQVIDLRDRWERSAAGDTPPPHERP